MDRNELVREAGRFQELVSGMKEKEHQTIGFYTDYEAIEKHFPEILEQCGGKFLHIADPDQEKDSSFFLGMIDFNQTYYNKANCSFARFLLEEVASVTIQDKLRTIGNDTYLILFTMYEEKEESEEFLSRIPSSLKKLYPEYHFIFMNQERENVLEQEEELDLGFIRSFLAGFSIYHFMPLIDMMNTILPENEEGIIYLAIPEMADFSKIFREGQRKVHSIEIENYIVSDCNPYVFRKEEFSKSVVNVVEINYEDLLQFQRFINIFHCKEHFQMVSGGDFPQEDTRLLLYTIGQEKVQGSILNERLKEMIENRHNEWSLIPDIILMYPILIHDVTKIHDNLGEYDSDMISYLHYLKMRLECETGVPYGTDGSDMKEQFKKRIERFYLGSVRCRITEEMIMDIMDREDVAVGSDLYVQLLLSIDRESNVGVLYVVSLSSPFLLSHLLDNVVRNQLMVVLEDDTICNLYAYISRYWGISISGSPKSYVTVPMDKKAVKDQELAALLMSETIYEEGEDFSQLVDKKIMKLVEDPYGMGQYDLAYVGVTSNTFVQFYPSYRGCKRYRLFWNSVTAFYIELILFEEAGTERYIQRLGELMSYANEDQPEVFLEKNRRYTTEYMNTVEFWDVQLNYPSSRHSIQMIRQAFREEVLLQRMRRYQEQVKNIFEINRELVDRQNEKGEKDSADTMNFILMILTIVSSVSAIYTIVDYVLGYVENNPHYNYYPVVWNLITLIVVIFMYIVRGHRKKRNS